MLNSRILALGLIWGGRAYFVVNKTPIFLPGEWRQRSKSELPNTGDHFWRQIKSLKTLNVHIFPFVILICLCLLINQFSCWRINVFFSEKHCPTSMADWHTNFPRFQVARPDHVQVESSRYCCPRALESFVGPWATNGTWHVLFQSESVFELGGITIDFMVALILGLFSKALIA